MTEIFPTLDIARSGETQWNLCGQHTGLTNLPLTEGDTLTAAVRQTAPRMGLHSTTP
jgi:broad specificity phosphatase PhoE